MNHYIIDFQAMINGTDVRTGRIGSRTPTTGCEGSERESYHNRTTQYVKILLLKNKLSQKAVSQNGIIIK